MHRILNLFVYLFLAPSLYRRNSPQAASTISIMSGHLQDNQDLDTIFSCKRSGLPFPPSNTNAKDTPVLICLAGFPDTASVWDPLVHQPELQTSHHIIALGLPGNHLDALPADHKWGYTIDEIQEALHKVVLYCSRQGAKHIHLLCHDWGASYGFLYVQEHKTEKLVQKYAALDIGIFKPNDMPLVGLLKMTSYIMWFAVCFVANNIFGGSFASIMLRLYPWKIIGPLNHKEIALLQAPKDKPHTTYPYFQQFKKFPRASYSYSGTKHLPVCFIYGTDKNINYHSKAYIDKLEQTPGCVVSAVDGGHWFYTEKPEQVAKTLGKFFLEATST